MKKLLFIVSMLFSIAYGQSKIYLRGDSVQLERSGGNSELILLNSTRNVTGGVLTNLGNGRTGFQVPSGSGGLSGGNLGSGLKLYYVPSAGVKSIFSAYGARIDTTTNSSGMTFGADTTVGTGLISWLRWLKLRDSLNTIFAGKQATGNYVTALTGDVTASGPGSVASTIASNAVTTTKINNNAVTLAKFQTISDHRVIGNISGSTATPSEVYVDISDTTARTDSTIPMWRSTTRQYVHVPYAGGGNYTTPFKIYFFPGARSRDPAIGDSVVQRDTFINRCLEDVRRNQLSPREGNTLQGYTYDKSTGTITFHPPFVANEEIELRFGNCIDSAQIPAPPLAWENLTFSAATSGTLTHTGDNWATTGTGGWANHGLDAKRLTGNGAIRTRYVSPDGFDCGLGFNATNASETYTGWEYGFVISTGGALYRANGGVTTSLSYTLSNNEYVKVQRTGSTFTIETSMDGSSWTVRYTFGTTSSATHYVNMGMFQDGKTYDPEGFGLVP